MSDQLSVAIGSGAWHVQSATIVPNPLLPDIPREKQYYDYTRQMQIEGEDYLGDLSDVSAGEELTVDDFCGKNDEIQGYIRRHIHKTKKNGNVHGNMFKKRPKRQRKIKKFDDDPAIRRGDPIWVSTHTEGHYSAHGRASMFALKLREDVTSDVKGGTVIVPIQSQDQIVRIRPRIAGGQQAKKI